MRPTPVFNPAHTESPSSAAHHSSTTTQTAAHALQTDVETFARALYARQVHALHSPPFTNYHRFAHIWLHDRYGHLRQANRLLTSTCDFLEMKACPCRFWKIAFQCLGMLRGIGPNSTQPTALQHLTNYAATTHASPSLRLVTIRPHWSLLEFFMEPLFYNTNIPGRWGAHHEDPQNFLTTTRQR